MALKINGTTSQTGLGNLLKEGTRHMQGVEEAVNRNIAACRQLCEIVRSSFGPCGLNKLVVNGLDQIFLTNDAGVIVRELEVEHPAARLLLLASQQQQREYGDATNFVLILAGEMLSLAEDLLRIGLKPSQIVEGYEVAVRLLFRDLNCEIDGQKVSLIESLKFYPTNESLESILRSTIASKHYGNEGILTKLVVDAISIVKTENRISNTSDSGPNLTIDPENIHIVKVLGGSLSLSTTFRGMLLGREPFGRVHSIQNAKIAVFACPINTSRTETKGTVLIKDAEQLLSFGKGEEAILAAQISSIAAVGVNVIVCGDVIGELALHYIERAGIMAIRLTSKFDVRRVCRATGATPLARLGSPTLEEIGSCLAVETVEVGGTRGTLFRQDTISSRIISKLNYYSKKFK